MKLKDLKDEVAALAFDEGVSLDKNFIASANRALITIFTERPVAKTVRLFSAEQAPLVYTPTMTHRGGEDITLPLKGKAYAFRVCGCGSFTLSDGIVRTTKSFDTEDTLYRGFIRTEGAKISFTGNLCYKIYGFSCYGELISENEADINEYTPTVSYDMNRLYGDFLAFLEAPRTETGVIPDATVKNGVLTLPRGKYDEVYLTYSRMPRRITADSQDAEIDVSGECSPLLSLLTTAYLWLDEDPERSQYYMSLYNSEMSFIRRYNTSHSSGEYRDVLGWA